ncbi:iron-containing alcohol dehydrogenase [Clostridium transplantifaecale]|nr:iron-containing alcohol dehydrogenase [Clostridium transplantifaecale]
MKNFEYNVPVDILFGKGQEENLAGKLQPFGKKDSADLWRGKC